MLEGIKVLHKTFTKGTSIHSKRLESLLDATESTIEHAKLSLTGIGRHLKGKAKVKHKIKRADRLLGNTKLYDERLELYKAQAHQLIGLLKEIIVLVDWSACVTRHRQILRASLALSGRSLVLYEEVHLEEEQNKQRSHTPFLERLKYVLPIHCHVIVVTDAGFKNPWFKSVEKQNWDWVGRVRNNTHYKLGGVHNWKSCNSLYEIATNRPSCVGHTYLAKGNPLKCSLYLYKEKPKGRVKLSGKGVRARSSKEQRYAEAAKEPWLIATSLLGGRKISKRVINIYNKRMQIEQNFRDTKNSHWGLSLCESGTKDIKRLEILLLISTLALFILWIIGWAAEKKKLHYSFQANTIRERRVLSYVFLGRQVLLHCLDFINTLDIGDILQEKNFLRVYYGD